MPDYLKKFTDLKNEYPLCKLKWNKPNEKINKYSLVIGICNKENCENDFEMQIIAVGRHGNIYCKECIKNIKNNKTAETLNTGKYEKIIENLNLKYPNIKLKSENKFLNERSKIKGICNTDNCENSFEATARTLNIDKMYCNQCKINRGYSKYRKTCENINRKKSKYVPFYEKLKNTYPNLNIKVLFDNKPICDKTRITGKCINNNCNNTFSKLLHSIEVSGCEKSMKCPECTIPVMQIAEVAEKQLKSLYKTKTYNLPSGKKLTVQGYENYAIDRLLNIEKIQEDDIVTSRTEVPECWYRDQSEKLRRYYTDIYIPSQNRCIEVKSKYTSQSSSIILESKINALKSLGYYVDIWIFNDKGELIP